MNFCCKKCGNPISTTTIGDYTCYRCNYHGNVLEEDFIVKNITADPTYLAGWVCPKCGAVMSPYQNYCINCTKFEITC